MRISRVGNGEKRGLRDKEKRNGMGEALRKNKRSRYSTVYGEARPYAAPQKSQTYNITAKPITKGILNFKIESCQIRALSETHWARKMDAPGPPMGVDLVSHNAGVTTTTTTATATTTTTTTKTKTKTRTRTTKTQTETLRVYQIEYVIVKAANSPRPAAWILERSVDNVNFQPWQYYAPSDEECWTRYSAPPVPGRRLWKTVKYVSNHHHHHHHHQHYDHHHHDHHHHNHLHLSSP
uniref:Laminin N-terminal domain-containing protein n=1 Tax=Vespula pensylvanica TaxID=30213 RepID=A0A834N8U1_VESPE|nr:hypothetical protein H0235_015807 [Vespula pensylvanica]